MDILNVVLMIGALICFLIGAVDTRTPPTRPNWTCCGLALLTLVWIVSRK